MTYNSLQGIFTIMIGFVTWPPFCIRWPSDKANMKLYTDASGTEGWGAFWSGRWLQARWSPTQADMPILWKELFAIVSAVNSWGHQ